MSWAGLFIVVMGDMKNHSSFLLVAYRDNRPPGNTPSRQSITSEYLDPTQGDPNSYTMSQQPFFRRVDAQLQPGLNEQRAQQGTGQLLSQ